MARHVITVLVFLGLFAIMSFVEFPSSPFSPTPSTESVEDQQRAMSQQPSPSEGTQSQGLAAPDPGPNASEGAPSPAPGSPDPSPKAPEPKQPQPGASGPDAGSQPEPIQAVPAKKAPMLVMEEPEHKAVAEKPNQEDNAPDATSEACLVIVDRLVKEVGQERTNEIGDAIFYKLGVASLNEACEAAQEMSPKETIAYFEELGQP